MEREASDELKQTEHNEPEEARWPRFASMALGVFVFLGGFVSLLAWIADVPRLAEWDGNGISIQPNTTLNVMACGAALVTYDNGGSRDYARDGETALVARRRDVAELADKLARLAADPALRARIAAAGTALVTTAFDWERAVERLQSVFHRAIRASADRP